jgi:hypothetical protein
VLENINLLKLLWLFTIAFAFHEYEEWNITKWYYRNFVDLPPLTKKGVRTWIIFMSVMFFWVFLCSVAGKSEIRYVCFNRFSPLYLVDSS